MLECFRNFFSIVNTQSYIKAIARKEFRGTECLACHNVADGTVNGAGSVTLDISDEMALLRAVSYAMWGIQLFIQAVLFFVVGWMISFVLGPVREMEQAMISLESNSDLSMRVTVHSLDEVGRVSRAFNNMMTSLQDALSNTNAVMGAVAAGDFSKRVTVAAHGDLALLKRMVVATWRNSKKLFGQSNAAASEEITATVVELARIADNSRLEVEKYTV